MKTKSRKRAYMTPECRVIATETESLLQSGSGNAGTIGGGTGGGDAKQWNGEWEEEEEEPQQWGVTNP